MALFNKLFSPLKSTCSNQENVSFTKEQVRVVLFRECDFRGRKLLFDSTAIKKIQINSPSGSVDSASNKKTHNGTFAEISNGYGYMYIKPPTDSSHLAEMIFGLVAMSYRGCYFKIHNLESPSRLMLTQLNYLIILKVFPSPKFVQRRKSSASSHGQTRISNQSLEQSICLDDSGTSISDHYSVHSTASDTFLICRQNIPFDVTQKLSGSSSSVVCDSGVYGERSYSSFDGTRQFSMIPFWESMPVKGSATSFSNSTLYKRWLRSSSLDHSVNSSNSSMEETYNKPHQRTSKLGLAFIIHLTSGQEESQIQFLMEHIALLESMLWRARQATEIAYLRPSNFLSVLMKMVNLSSGWLTNLISSPLLPLNLWTTLYNNSDRLDNHTDCDNNNSIKCSDCSQKETLSSLRSLLNTSNSGLLSASNSGDNINVLSDNQSEKYEFSFHNITRIIKNEWDYFNAKLFRNCNGNNLVEKFVQDFCELLDTIDVKDTNFFMSTLLTAVLTHHLGWVATCLPRENEDQIFLDLDMPFNPLWGQLCDLYGAVGHPSKMAQTIVIGNKKKDIIAKIINCLTYFIRCSELERKNSIRTSIDIDNKTADYICHKTSCIPKENFKKYKDHLREMLNSNKLDNIKNDNELSMSRKLPESLENRLNKGLGRSKKTQYNLNNLDKEVVETENIFGTRNSSGLHKNSNWMDLKELDNLVCANSSNSMKSNCDIQIEDKKENVVFVLGDDEKLVNIKKGEKSRRKSKCSKEDKIKNDNMIKRLDSIDKTSVPNFLESIFKKYETFEEEFSRSHFKDEDFIKYETDSCIKPSTSWASLQQAEEEDITREIEAKLSIDTDFASSSEKPFVRSQSVPPKSEIKTVKEEVKAKYRYSGVKFSLHQYPQVVTNYMRSKNLEMSNLSFSEITKRFDQMSLDKEEDYADYSQYENNDEMEALQTPSNASELEFTSEITIDRSKHRHARESCEKPSIPNVSESMEKEKIIKLNCFSNCEEKSTEDIPKMKIIYFPMPKSETLSIKKESIPYPLSLMRGVNDDYIPDLVLQGTSAPKKGWEATLKNELSLSSQHCLLDQPLEEAVAIIADTDTWEVQLVSSHTYVIDKNSSGVKVGMSQLIASMLDSLLKMWKLQVPPQLCMMHIEQRLQALCVTSRAVAQLLLATEFCSMEFLTSTLHLEVNDVPLLLAVASTFSPQVTQKYGISFH
ncbi:folliculin-interacting protein 2 isoform X2 [Harmonia axyridis]|uniref:folliculin-interacting protein 2 isoform X2 n=1 Tax=Harmonia axyridis TaxID=115357 RepID=UPI001E2775CB|nr:folliculin-interacting protein 2 isoform X2 [Harmonia axyridis]